MESLREKFRAQHPILVEAIFKLSHSISHSSHAYLVGGFVRDLLLGLSPTDADIEVYGMSVDDLETLLNNLFSNRVNLVGRAFGVFKIALDHGLALDIALPRRESKIGLGHKDFSIEGDPHLTPLDASRRRDFTVNAIMLNPLTEEILDPWNGRQDLHNRVLRMVDQDHFDEDPLRVYRAIQFSARFSLTIESRTMTFLQEMVQRSDLDHLPSERVTEEWRKLLLKAEKPSIGLELMREFGIVEKYYPELQALIGVEQDPEWHPEGDVWIHTLLCVDAAASITRFSRPKADPPLAEILDTRFSILEQLQVMLGALCHDFGKASTTMLAPKQGVMRIRSLGHEEAGVIPTQTFCDRLCFGDAVNQAALVATREHLKPGMLNRAAQKDNWSEEQYTNAVRKLLKRIHPVSWQVLVAVSEADFRGRTLPESSAPGYSDGERVANTIKKFRLDEAPAKPLLSGSDLLAFGIKPGPEMGRLIRLVEDARDQGQIKTKEEALERVKSFLAK